MELNPLIIDSAERVPAFTNENDTPIMVGGCYTQTELKENNLYRGGGLVALIVTVNDEKCLAVFPDSRGKDWRLPGGRYDMHDKDLVMTALRECAEETKVYLTEADIISIDYVWRQKKSENIVDTIIFANLPACVRTIFLSDEGHDAVMFLMDKDRNILGGYFGEIGLVTFKKKLASLFRVDGKRVKFSPALKRALEHLR